MKPNTGQALETLRYNGAGESVYSRIGRAVTSIVPSEVSAIEVFDRSGEYAERRWADPEPIIRQHYERLLTYRDEHPLFQEFVRSGLTSPIRISDRMGMPKLLSTSIYNEFFRPLGIQRQMAVALPSDSIGLPVLVLGRSGADYTSQEQQALRCLLPICAEQIVLEQAQADYDLLFKQLLTTNAAIALVSFHRFISSSTPEAIDLLHRYFPDEFPSRQRLPNRVVEWLRSSTAGGPRIQMFRTPQSPCSLVVSVCRSGTADRDLLVMKEKRPPKTQLATRFNLSPRLTDVLLLLIRGQSNKEIATELGISPHTVRTLVEQLLYKMAVSNRTEAAARARGALES